MIDVYIYTDSALYPFFIVDGFCLHCVLQVALTRKACLSPASGYWECSLTAGTSLTSF